MALSSLVSTIRPAIILSGFGMVAGDFNGDGVLIWLLPTAIATCRHPIVPAPCHFFSGMAMALSKRP